MREAGSVPRGGGGSGPPARAWRLAASEWTLREKNTVQALGRIADAGFDAVELGGRDLAPAPAVRALAATGLDVTSVCPLFGPEHDFAADDPSVRRAAADLLRRGIDLAGEVGGHAVIVVASDRPVAGGAAPRSELLARAADTIATALAADGTDSAPVVVIEPLNRYETHLIRTLDEAEQLRRAIDSPRVELMADVFHMNIEEDSVIRSLRDHAPHLAHVHLADNHRRAPGSGQLDFGALFAVLADVGYAGNFALELVPATSVALRQAREHLERWLPNLDAPPPG
jgi:sugar phosphate isomerase/epimerase